MEKTRFRMWSQSQNDRIWIYLLYKLLIFRHPFQAGGKVSRPCDGFFIVDIMQ